jgi:hypothetical protein
MAVATPPRGLGPWGASRLRRLPGSPPGPPAGEVRGDRGHLRRGVSTRAAGFPDQVVWSTRSDGAREYLWRRVRRRSYGDP